MEILFLGYICKQEKTGMSSCDTVIYQHDLKNKSQYLVL